jgi:hypothetical protein
MRKPTTRKARANVSVQFRRHHRFAPPLEPRGLCRYASSIRLEDVNLKNGSSQFQRLRSSLRGVQPSKPLLK